MKRIVLGLAIAVVLGGCSSGSTSGTHSYNDGYTYAQQSFISQGQSLQVTPAAECSLLASQGNVPGPDDLGQWESGCAAALATVSQGTTATS